MQQFNLVIHNATGLHARPARVFVDIAKQYESVIQVRHGTKQANAKSLISLLTLGVTGGQIIYVDITGSDEEVAAVALAAAIRNGLGEGPAPQEKEVDSRPSEVATQPQPEQVVAGPAEVAANKAPNIVQGVAAAPGIAVGPVYQFKRSQLEVNESSAGVSQEQARLQTALEAARQQIASLHEQVLQRGAVSEGEIFEVHRDILADPTLLDPVHAAIDGGQSAAWAWQSVVKQYCEQLSRLADPLLAERSVDVRDVGDRVLRLLTNTTADPGPSFQTDSPVVILAYDLTPSETAVLDPERVLGICTVVGGPNAHTAILARALGLPAVVRAGSSVLEIADGTTVILDGTAGTLIVAPEPPALEAARLSQQKEREQRTAARQRADEPALTSDGHTVEVVANIGGLADAERANGLGAEGVGLFRTEFLFLNRAEAPSEDEQFEIYRDVARAMDGKPVIIRTLDIGGDKPIAYLNLPAEDNPFLGLRGIRLCLEHPALFRQQLRAILRASSSGKLRIMFPMIADSVELRAAKAIVEEVRAELGVPPVEIGIMVEVPSAALMADELAKEVDFFSIGTNDLTQYTLAMDRTNSALASRADGLHPAVLRLIARTVEAAHCAGKWVGVCGELGSDTQAVPILVGLGVDELSVSSPAVPTVKAQIRSLTLAECQVLGQAALKCGTAEQVRAGGTSSL